ncbi:hypothetical protein AB0L25_39015 [Spirillospora sp. NPDC052242]
MNLLVRTRTRACACDHQAKGQSRFAQQPTPGVVLSRLDSRLRDVLARRITGCSHKLGPVGARADLLAHAFAHPQGTGFIGAGAHGFLRAAFTEALTSKIGVSWVLTTGDTLERLFDGTLDDELLRALSSRLHVAETLENAVERLEFEADVTSALRVRSDAGTLASTVLWIATPGPHSDVVHDAITHWPADNLVVFADGPWPYGPTYLIENNGPRPLPRRPIGLLTPQQAVTDLKNAFGQ